MVAHVRVDAGREIVIHGPDLVHGDTSAFQYGDGAIKKPLGVRRSGRPLQRAVEDHRSQATEVKRALLAQLGLVPIKHLQPPVARLRQAGGEPGETQ